MEPAVGATVATVIALIALITSQGQKILCLASAVVHGNQGVLERESNGRRGSPGQGIESLAGESGFSPTRP